MGAARRPRWTRAAGGRAAHLRERAPRDRRWRHRLRVCPNRRRRRGFRPNPACAGSVPQSGRLLVRGRRGRRATVGAGHRPPGGADGAADGGGRLCQRCGDPTPAAGDGRRLPGQQPAGGAGRGHPGRADQRAAAVRDSAGRAAAGAGRRRGAERDPAVRGRSRRADNVLGTGAGGGPTRHRRLCHRHLGDRSAGRPAGAGGEHAVPGPGAVAGGAGARGAGRREADPGGADPHPPGRRRAAGVQRRQRRRRGLRRRLPLAGRPTAWASTGST